MYATKSNSSGYREAPPDPDDQESLVTVRPRLKRVNTGVSSRGNESVVRVGLGSPGSRPKARQKVALDVRNNFPLRSPLSSEPQVKTDTSDHVSVVDSRWVGELPGETVKQLQLLVHDARKPELEMEWINAGLAGTFWPSAVLKFFLDNMVIRREEMVDSHRIRTIYQRLVDGWNHMREGKDVLRIVGILGVEWQEWMKWREPIERDEKLLKDMHILADDKVDPSKSDVETEGANDNFMNNNRSTENNVAFGKRNGESIVSAKANTDDPTKPAAELTQARVVSLSPEIDFDSFVDYEIEIAVESHREPNKRSVMKCCYLKSFDRCTDEYFLCEVSVSDGDVKHVETVLRLKDLQTLAPELLIKFLQKRMENNYVDEDLSSEGEELEDS